MKEKKPHPADGVIDSFLNLLRHFVADASDDEKTKIAKMLKDAMPPIPPVETSAPTPPPAKVVENPAWLPPTSKGSKKKKK